MKHKAFSALLACILCLCMCIGVASAEKASLSLDKTKVSAIKGISFTLKAKQSGSSDALSWSTSDATVADVSHGVVRTYRAGTAIITVTTGKLSAACKVLVTDVASSLSLSKETLTIGVGQSYQAEYTLTPANPSEAITWTTVPATNAPVSVTKDGLIKAGSKEGKAYVVAMTKAGKTARIRITVVSSDKAVESVKISTLSASVTPGASIRLAAKAYPLTAQNRKITWKSKNPLIATVDPASGIVTGVAKGTVVIQAIASNGMTRDCTVTVHDIQVQSVQFTKTKASLSVGQKGKLTPNVQPNNAADRTLTWTSSAPDIASVDGSGVVKGLRAGQTTVSATSANGKSASVVITVKDIPVKTLKLSKKSLSISVGTSGTIKPQITPEKASKKVAWHSSNPKVVSVDNNGKVTALSAGTAVITATSQTNSKAKASCTIRVVANTYKRSAAYTAGKPSAWITGAYIKNNELRVQVCYYNAKPYVVEATRFGDEVLLYSSATAIRCRLPIASTQLLTGTLKAKSAKTVVYTFSCEAYPQISALNLNKLHSNSRVG